LDVKTRNEINKLKSDLLKARKQRDYFRDELSKCIAEKIEMGKDLVEKITGEEKNNR
jgi:hypothetical protein